MELRKITIRRYRSIKNLSLDFTKGQPLIICGPNNVGKTNFLRALDLFFSLDVNKFEKDRDVPYDIIYGRSTGSRYNSTITGFFIDEKSKNEEYVISATYQWKQETGNTLKLSAKKNGSRMAEQDAAKLLTGFRYLFIEASNIDIPKIIREIIDEEVLPLGLDKKRRRQTLPLKKLNSFIKESKKSVASIEEDIQTIFNKYVLDLAGDENSSKWKTKILFSEYEKLREALSRLVDFTLEDSNDRKLESKGSGIQRAILLSLMEYISQKSKRKIIWGIDEPEVFLQPSLQKRTFNILRNLSKIQDIFLTTHSQHFVNIGDVTNTYLFEAKYQEKEFARNRGKVITELNTLVDESLSSHDKIQNIKEHLGIDKNDNWEILPYNILVEGDEDKKYLETLFENFGLEKQNILVSGGASKFKGYLQFLAEFCSDLKFKPTIKCIFDHDDEGKKEYKALSLAISKRKYSKFDLRAEFIPRVDGVKGSKFDYEIEDFIFPEVIRDSANKFLKNQKYKPVDKRMLTQRFKTAYNSKPILNYLTKAASSKNEEKEEINFEDFDRGVKKIICKNSCDYIKNNDISALNLKYPSVKKFIDSLSKTI
jgi:predicted ATP-dependent endonuclease of OLD family